MHDTPTPPPSPPLSTSPASTAAENPVIFASASSIIRAIMLTASTGYFPDAVSAESITASDPSKIAFATSDASARVGRGFCVIDSSICVAVITGRRASRARAMIIFCTTGTRSGLISTPRSPRAPPSPHPPRAKSHPDFRSLPASPASRLPAACRDPRAESNSSPSPHLPRAAQNSPPHNWTPSFSANARSARFFRRQRHDTRSCTPGKLIPLFSPEHPTIHHLTSHPPASAALASRAIQRNSSDSKNPVPAMHLARQRTKIMLCSLDSRRPQLSSLS